MKSSIRSALAARWLRGLDGALARRAVNRVKAERGSVAATELRADLKRLPLPDGAIVFVHSSLSALGFVEGGAATVVDALIDLVVEKRGGTLALPAFSLSGTMAETLRGGQVFDARTSPSRVGAITEEFRRRPGARRSVHPTHSVAALGPRAAWLTGSHHLCGSTFGPASPLGRLLEADGWILGLGVSLAPVTFYHVLEEHRPDFPLAVYTPDSPIAALCVDTDGVERRLSIMAHDPIVAATRIDRAAGTFVRTYYAHALSTRAGLRWFDVGRGRAWLVGARAMYAEIERLMERGITIYSTREQVVARDATAADIRADPETADTLTPVAVTRG